MTELKRFSVPEIRNLPRWNRVRDGWITGVKVNIRIPVPAIRVPTIR